MNGIQHYGIKEFTKLTSKLDANIEELRITGYTTIPDVVDTQLLDLLRQKIDAVYERQVEEISGTGALEEINDSNIARALLVYDEAFLKLAVNPLFLEVASCVLGDYFILQMQNAIINRPSQRQYQTSWHRDLNYQHFVSSRPLAISILLCVDPFSEETGGTIVPPGTDKFEAFPSEQFVHKHEHQISAPAGSILVMDAMLYHRAGYNRSRQVRRAINNIYCLPFMKQQISLPRMLAGKYRNDPSLSRILGYDSEPGESVTEWRKAKLKKKVELETVK